MPNPYDPGFFEENDLVSDLDTMRAAMSRGWIKDFVGGSIKRTQDGVTLISDRARLARGAGESLHPWKLIDATNDAFLGRIVRACLRTTAAYDSAAAVVNLGPFALPALAKGYLSIILDAEGNITSQSVVVGENWWAEYPTAYRITGSTPETQFQSGSFIPLFELVESPGDLDIITDTTSDPPVTYGIKQFVTTAVELMDRVIDGKSIRVPLPAAGAA